MSVEFPREFPCLASPRLELGPLGEGDTEALFAIYGDPAVMRYWSTPAWPDAAPAAALLHRDREAFERGDGLRFGVRLRGASTPVGTISLYALSVQNRRAEIGYILGRQHWGRGLMREALGAVLDWAFGPLGLIRVEADTDPRNAPSLALLARLGFVREGLLRSRWIVNGEVCDSVMLGLLKDERPQG